MKLLGWELRKAPRPSPLDDFWYTFVSQIAKTGQSINPDSAMRFSGVWAAVRLISESIASLPLVLYQNKGKSREKAEDHPLYKILHDAPNDEMTSMQFREAMLVQLLLWGNSYSYIERALNNQVISLWPLEASQVEPERGANGEIQYRYRPTNRDVRPINMSTEERVFPKELILHVAGLSYNGLVGLSPIEYAKESIALGLASEEFASRFFANNAAPKSVIEVPVMPNQKDMDAFRESWEKEYKGLQNQSKIGILPLGAKIQNLSMPLEEAQFIEQRKFSIIEICRIFRIPPHLLQSMESSTNNNIEEQGLEFVTHCLRPWGVRIEQAINNKLISPKQSGNLFVEHNFEGLLRGNLSARFTAFSQAIQGGWMSRNEAREKENWNPEPDLDEFLQPVNMQVVGEEPPEPSKPEPLPSPNTEEQQKDKELAGAMKKERGILALIKESRGRVERRVAIQEKRGKIDFEDLNKFVEDELEVLTEVLRSFDASEDRIALVKDEISKVVENVREQSEKAEGLEAFKKEVLKDVEELKKTRKSTKHIVFKRDKEGDIASATIEEIIN